MILAASRAISLSGILIPKAGEFIAAANAVTVAGFGRGFDWDQGHRFSPTAREAWHGEE
jgi:hypothetical protein